MPPRQSSAFIRPLRTPSKAFVTFLAAAGFAAALLLTPTVQLDLPLARVASPTVGLSNPGTEAAAVMPRDSATLETDVVNRYDHLPLAQIFRRRADAETANRVARAIVKEARELQISPSLLAGVLITENARLEPETISHRGAVGLMQVMRFHAGVFDCDSDDLLQVEANICHGSRVFAGYLKRTKDVRSALLRYNGCVRSRATASCKRYPGKVLREAEIVRQQLLHYLPSYQLKTLSAGRTSS
jgi:soluble lytic murein transglycosylase-like protein